MKKRTLPFLALMIGAIAFAQTYNNGPLSTGATSSNGSNAPAGYTWSELQVNNSAYGSTGVDGFILADDFVVPTDQKWNITSVEVFGYQTNATTNPFASCMIQFYGGGAPNAGGTVVAGSASTNVLSSSTDAKMYRISQTTINTFRKIWNLKSNVNASLTSGTYWIAYTATAGGTGSGFFPSVTIPGQAAAAGSNAIQYNPNQGQQVWVPLIDQGSGEQQALPFILTYTVETMGTSEVRQYDSRVSVYPNPSTDYFKLNLPAEVKAEVKGVELYDMSGKLVKSFKPADSYSIADLAKGVYVVKIKGGAVVKATRIVKN